MIVIIPRITASTTRKDLRTFVGQFLDKRLRLPFSAKPQIVACNILSITNGYGVTQRHGLINVTPDDAALNYAETQRRIS